MVNESLLEQIRRLTHAFLGPDNNIMPTLSEGVQAIAAICKSLVLVADSNGAVLASGQDVAEIDSHLSNLVEEGTLVSDSGLFRLIKSKTSLYNEPYPIGSDPDGKNKTGVGINANIIVVPIAGSGKTNAALFLYRQDKPFKTEQLILAEVGAALVGLLVLQIMTEKADQAKRNAELAEGAFESLSYSEVEAIQEILKNINNNESVVVASKIADNLGITRSVIVNALRKFESAGIIESRSLGMKGTFIRVKNLHALEIIASRSAKMSHIR